ncbi:MAG TPA: DUF4340 domain-containing protein [Verrucomicrobiae bacterium]|jgi:hypothetical protein
MKTKSTIIWLVLALALFAFICFWQNHWRPAAPVALRLLPGLRAAEVTSVEVTPAGALAFRASRTNGVWQLEKPFRYPAQTAAIETLLTTLEKVTPALRITAAEVGAHKNSDTDFGFDNPQFRLDLTAGEQSWHLLIGNKTAPGDQVFVRVVGTEGVFVADVNWLQFLPATVTAWRDTSLVDATAAYDWIVITNGAKVIELHRDPASRLWRMTWPLTPARADSDRINRALQQLRSASVLRFVTDDAKADLATFGLQPADLDLRLGNGTNLTAGIHVGKATAEIPTQVYARRDGWNSVVTVTNDVFTPWRAGVNAFRDAHLLSLTAPVAEIEVTGTNHFTLQLESSGEWQVVGEKFSVDAEMVRDYIRTLAGFQVAEFRKDITTGTDLQNFGLTTPPQTEQITLRSAVGGTNAVIVQLLFGTMETNKIYVKRADENYVYALANSDFTQLKTHGWQFRDRQVWNFSETNIVQITSRQNGKTRTVLRNGVNSWVPAPGSQGIVDPFALEETAHRLSDLTALGWVERNYSKPEELGFNPKNLSLTVELKSGEKLAMDFGMELPSANTGVAAVTLDGERWAFVFPPAAFFYVSKYLTIPADAP